MALWPSSEDGEMNMKRDERYHNELATGVNGEGGRRSAQILPPTSSWLPSNGNHPPFSVPGFNMPPVNHSSIPPLFEFAIHQQKLGMEQQARLAQMMNQAVLSRRRITPHGTVDPMSTEEDQAEMAMQRLSKKCRVAKSSLRVADSKGRSSCFPMPRPGEYIPTISLQTFRQVWESLEDRARSLFSDDIVKQREYVKWRFSTFLRGSRMSLSKMSMPKRKESAP